MSSQHVREYLEIVDDLGPAKVLFVSEETTGLRGLVVVDNTARGPAIGGVRMAPDVSIDECLRLARAMTLKNAAAGLRHGGGKSVIAADPGMPPADKEALMRAFAGAIGDLAEYIPGPDMGTNEESMAWVHDEIGRAVGLPESLGGIPLDVIGATGFGLAAAIEAAEPWSTVPVRGARIVIEGFGAVGRHAARFLTERGAVLVGASDSQGAVADPVGLDVAVLAALKAGGKSVASLPGAVVLARDGLLDVDCDIWIPAAGPDVITEANVDRLRTKMVVQGANIPATPGAEQRLAERGVLVVPDFIANAGGVICAAVEYQGGTRASAFAAIDDLIRANTAAVLGDATARGVLPRQAAIELAKRRVREASKLRRWR